jgi:hypothetical protein
MNSVTKDKNTKCHYSNSIYLFFFLLLLMYFKFGCEKYRNANTHPVNSHNFILIFLTLTTSEQIKLTCLSTNNIHAWVSLRLD